MGKRKVDLNEYAEAVLRRAEDGIDDDETYIFITTWKRYQEQLSILDELAEERAKSEATITKEYVKGRQNICINPVITEYNKTATAANNTAKTLRDIIGSMKVASSSDDEFTEFLKK